jgi:hypothetical protein
MKVFAVGFVLLLAGIFCLGQQPRAQLTLTGAGCAVTCTAAACSQATAFIARTSGSPSTAQKNAWTAFICGGVTDGWWAKMDVVQLYASSTQANALLNLVSSSFNATAVSSPTFTANNGFNPTNTPSYIDSGFNPTTASINLTQNAAHYSACSIETGGSDYGLALWAFNSGSTSDQTNLFPKYSDGNTYSRLNDGVASSGNANAGNTTGYWGSNRSGVSASQAYLGGSVIFSPNATSGSIVNADILLGSSSNGTPQAGYEGLIMAFTAGGALLSADWSNLYSRLHTYNMTIAGQSC